MVPGKQVTRPLLIALTSAPVHPLTVCRAYRAVLSVCVLSALHWPLVFAEGGSISQVDILVVVLGAALAVSTAFWSR